MNSGIVIQSLDRAAGLDDVQDDEDTRDDDQRPTDQPEEGKASGHQAGRVHQPPRIRPFPTPTKKPGPIRNVHW